MNKENWEELEKCSVSELENLAFEISEKTKKPRNRDLRNILQMRQHKLNKEFEFTPEHIEKFLWLDQEIKKHLNHLRKEGVKLLEDLEKLTKSGNSYFNDYEIEAVINPKILIWREEDQSLTELEEEDGILNVIDDFHHKKHFCLEFSPRHFEHSLYFDEPCDKDFLNWNTTIHKWRDLIAANKELAHHHIGYGMHELYDHSLWALQDIMQINDFWCELKVDYQKFSR